MQILLVSCKLYYDSICSPSVGYVAHPVGKIPNLKKVIGRAGHCKGGLGCYVTAMSDRDRNKEVSIAIICFTMTYNV